MARMGTMMFGVVLLRLMMALAVRPRMPFETAYTKSLKG